MVIWKSVDKSVCPAKKRIEPGVESEFGWFIGKPKFIDTKMVRSKVGYRCAMRANAFLK
jgi:hypothetical protein